MTLDTIQAPLLDTTADASSVLSWQAPSIAATRRPESRFCNNNLGWGLTPDQSTLTPCTTDAVTLGFAAIFGILLGLSAIYYLFTQPKNQKSLFKQWNFIAKLVVLCLLIGITAAQAIYFLVDNAEAAIQDVQFWTPVAVLLSLLVISTVQYIENWRSRCSNAIVLIYWSLFIFVYAFKTASIAGDSSPVADLHYFAFALSVLEMTLEWTIPVAMQPLIKPGPDAENPRATADLFSTLIFSWAVPLLKYGYKNTITEKDLYSLRTIDSSHVSGERFEEAWVKRQHRKNPGVWIPIFLTFGAEYSLSALYEFSSVILQLVQPILLRYFIQWVSSRNTSEPQPWSWGIGIAFFMFAASVAQTIFNQQTTILTLEIGSRIRSALQTKLYAKALKLSSSARGKKPIGDIVNLMSVDTGKFIILFRFFSMIWSAPLQFGLAMVLLQRIVGWAPMLAGVGVTIVITPLNGLVVHFSNLFNTKGMKAKDERTRITTEIVENMKYIKLYGGWSEAYFDRLQNVRNKNELKWMTYEAIVDGSFNILWSLPRYIVAGLTFIVFVATQKDRVLNSEIIFPALALFNMLNFPLSILPALIAVMVDTAVSARRLGEFYNSDELQTDAVERQDGPVDAGEELVSIGNALITPGKDEEKVLLEVDHFGVQMGQKVCVIGKVGSGKSTLLSTLLGDLYRKSGRIAVKGSIAYVPQTAWIMNATVKDNILFGRPLHTNYYNQVLKACALLPDLASLPNGDKTEVGERGISLSGGQKARLSIARAVYSSADLYLMDDCLAAVDEHVSKHLIDNVIGPKGLLKDKAIILATNTTRVLKSADMIYYLEEGKIASYGTLTELLANDGNVKELIKSQAKEEKGLVDESGSGLKTPDVTITEAASSSDTPTTIAAAAEDADKLIAAVIAATAAGTDAPDIDPVTEEPTENTPLLADDKTIGKTNGHAAEENEESIAAGKKVEASAKGKVAWRAYTEYIKACGPFSILWLVALLAGQAFALGSGLWVKYWSDLNTEAGYNYEPRYYITVYFAFGLISALMSGVDSITLEAVCSIRAAKQMHERLARAVMNASMSFFETTPAGQILNRFSSDINKVDRQLIRTVSMTVGNLLYVLFTLAVVIWATPLFLIFVLPMAWACVYLQKFYVSSTRETSRLESSTKSPIFSHFQESLNGVTSVRGYGKERVFSEDNENRIDANLRAYYSFIAANRFILSRLEIMGSLTVGGSAGLIVAAMAAGYRNDGGAVGLALSYALQVVQALSWLVRMTVEIENNMVCVERILEYTDLPSERFEGEHPPKSWPEHGDLTFKDYSVRYREGLPLVLENINLAIKPQERIGIVGRTGAGKSTLTLALFRLIEANGGQIDIDGLNTSEVALNDLRSSLSIIPQDSMIVAGTIRHNLDPASKYTDADLWRALEYAQLKDHISSMDGKLEAEVQTGGQNLSAGQRQLMSLARVLLSSNRVLVLDEATSAVDSKTDEILQQTLRSDVFKDKTIIVIAHRINTIVDSDRVVVLDRGRVVEFASPAELVAKGGLFKDLVVEAGLLERFQNGA